LVRRRPKLTYKALVLEIGGKVSYLTIRRVLRFYQLRKWESKKRLSLTKEGVKARREFAQYWLESDRRKTLLAGKFSDECTIQNNTNNPVAWVFRYPSEKWNPDFVNLKGYGKANISIMIWAMIFKGGRSPIVVMKRDSTAKRNGYTAESYRKALEEGLLPFYKPEDLFQQDNAKIHRANSI
jgi:hypothetical protein